MTEIQTAEQKQEILEKVQETLEKLSLVLPVDKYTKGQTVAILQLFMELYYS